MNQMNVWGMTDIGLVRKENQDAYVTAQHTASGRTVGVVCDGMGGPAGGRVASQIAVSVYLEELEKLLTADQTPQQLLEASAQAAALANQAIQAEAERREECRNMGTTLVSAISYDGGVVVTNVGDSRAYHITEDGITRITKDHSLVESMVDRGDITAEEARRHPSRNLITRALGPDISADCDGYICPMNAGEYLLLCSDGLVNTVTDQEMLFEVIHGDGPDTYTVPKLVGMTEEQANEQASVADGTFQVVVAGTEASDAAVGEIVRQDPEPDTEKKGELPITINVWVSAGEDVGTMPDLTTKPMTYDQAMTILQDLVAEYELNVQPYEETQKEYDDELAVDVIKSTTPAANEELHKGDTITFVLSRGPQTVPLIDFTNRERAWAEDQLKNVLGLEVEVHEEANDTVEAGLVIRQNPTATTQVPAGSTVELWVSTGPESGGNEDLQMEPLIIALPTDRETAEVQIVVDGVIKVNESVPCRDGNYVYELYGTGTVSVEVYVDGVMDVNNTHEVTFGE